MPWIHALTGPIQGVISYKEQSGCAPSIIPLLHLSLHIPGLISFISLISYFLPSFTPLSYLLNTILPIHSISIPFSSCAYYPFLCAIREYNPGNFPEFHFAIGWVLVHSGKQIMFLFTYTVMLILHKQPCRYRMSDPDMGDAMLWFALPSPKIDPGLCYVWSR